MMHTARTTGAKYPSSHIASGRDSRHDDRYATSASFFHDVPQNNFAYEPPLPGFDMSSLTGESGPPPATRSRYGAVGQNAKLNGRGGADDISDISSVQSQDENRSISLGGL